jgi:diaminopimelate decarboxylase
VKESSDQVMAAGLGELPADVAAAGISTGRPTYVYDLVALRNRCSELGRLPIRRKRVFFASMANDHPQLIECIKEAGHGVFVNSLKHMRIALDVGMPPDRMLYASSNMVEDEMRACADLGIRVILDSVPQVRRFGLIAGSGHEIGLRVSVGFVDGTSLRDDPEYRFGVRPDELPKAVAVAAEHGIRVAGVHSYFGTNLPAAPLVDGIGRLADAAASLPDITFLDAGGGFGVAMPGRATFDFGVYTSGVSAHLDRLEQRIGRLVEFVIEPGRYLAASCGYFFVTVVDVKERADRVFIGTNGSVATFPRPLIYPDRAEHPVGVIGRDPLEPTDPRPVYVSGSSTYSQDFLARGIELPLPQVGDILVFAHAGAYCRSMMTRFLGKDEPLEIVLDRDREWGFANSATTGTSALAEA